MYKKKDPYSNKNEIRLLAYIYKNPLHVHTNQSYPVRHKYDECNDRILYFIELELEYINCEDNPYRLPHFSIENVFFGKEIPRDTLGRLLPIIKYEFKESFNREFIYSIMD
jgi:hypothetical protein